MSQLLPLEQIDRPPNGAQAKILCQYYREIFAFTVSDQLSISDIYFSWTMSRLPCRVRDSVGAPMRSSCERCSTCLSSAAPPSRTIGDYRLASPANTTLISIQTGEDRHGPES